MRAGRPARQPLDLLSDREREVLDRVLEGHTYPSVARALGLSPHTVDTYMRRIRAKTGATHRLQLLRLAMADALETGSGATGNAGGARNAGNAKHTGDTRGHAHPDRR
ncbi:response regulator transcription factor [Streptomyces rhizosphaericus]|uniref:Helix-turn-helix transcriptional regulator n=1 Tax=Streptomyces rhizosphaericus TaxID=114699 RepID=A0A6G4A984_9ACTN|nr:helix-turn-helix transcriptional regulator [Streptomyces rhizosphaericus]NEW69780.1 helix-turn-helix transcriptional regulator [Streptomyces rhizosphaericus]